MKVLDVVGAYRITHHDNLKAILEVGIYATNQIKPDPDYTFIADRKLTDQRQDQSLPPPFQATTLGDYVPLYFGKRSVMLYTIKAKEMARQEDIIYLLVRLTDLESANCNFVFTDGHASSSLTNFYDDKRKLDQLDWAAINARDFRNTLAEPDRTRRKSAELLVLHHLPATCICHIVCKNNEVSNIIKQVVVNSSLPTIPVSTNDRDFYFP